MKAELTIENPGELMATMAFTFSLSQWVEIQKVLKGTPHYGPTGLMKNAIDDLAAKACDTLRFVPPEDEI